MMEFLFRVYCLLPKPLQKVVAEVRFFLFRVLGRPKQALESTKARPRREREGFFAAYCNGKGLDVGYGGDLLTSSCTGWDIEHGDAQLLQGVADSSFEFVYTSHTLEHMVDPVVALRNWWRVVKPSGYLILYIPHRDFYEKRDQLPSRWNPDHKHFFMLGREDLPDTKDIIMLIARALTSYEIVYSKECSEGHTITDPEIHSDGEYSIEVVLKKLAA